MQVLFAISTLCLLALVWAGIALARHARNGQRDRKEPSRPPRDFADHLFSAADTAASSVPRTTPRQTIREITARKSWNQPYETITLHPGTEPRPDFRDTAEPIQGIRKSPQAARQRGSERLDWTYFNQDLGDLTDPYQDPRIRANSSSTPPKRY